MNAKVIVFLRGGKKALYPVCVYCKNLCVHLGVRKRINITLDDSLYKNLKKRAGKEKATISGIIETALKKTVLRKKESGLLELLDSLPPSRLTVSGDLKKLYFESKA